MIYMLTFLLSFCIPSLSHSLSFLVFFSDSLVFPFSFFPPIMLSPITLSLSSYPSLAFSFSPYPLSSCCYITFTFSLLLLFFSLSLLPVYFYFNSPCTLTFLLIVLELGCKSRKVTAYGRVYQSLEVVDRCREGEEIWSMYLTPVTFWLLPECIHSLTALINNVRSPCSMVTSWRMPEKCPAARATDLARFHHPNSLTTLGRQRPQHFETP